MTGAETLDVHQFVPSLLPRDAVGNHTLSMQRELRAEGATGAIWAGAVHPRLARRASTWDRFEKARPRRDRRRVLVYQAASFSGGFLDVLGRRPEPKVICYHNVTPASFVAPYDPAAARDLALASEELRRLASCAGVAVAASEYNAADLREMGFERVHVVPPYIGSTLDRADADTLKRVSAGHRGIDLLFVGRLTPNKGHAHLVRLLATLRASVDPAARLFLVGAPGPSLYVDWLVRMIDRVAPGGVVLTGAVPDPCLAALYRNADVFVCLSSHEGFGVPLVEAMRAGVPVLAYDAGAVGETLAGTGVLVRNRQPAFLVELVCRMVTDAGLRSELLRHQRRRAAELEAFPRGRALVAALTEAAG